MASRGANSEQPAGAIPLPHAALAPGSVAAAPRCNGATPRRDAGNATLQNLDLSLFTRVQPVVKITRLVLAPGAGVCLHRRADGGFAVEVHSHDERGGYLLSMTQAEAAKLAARLMMFAQLVPGEPVGDQ